jgi:hypothetical protein
MALGASGAPAMKGLDKLVTASEALFQAGMADPRGGEYRIIDLHVGSVWSGDGGAVTTHGWLLPQDGPQGQRYAVAWNGLVYPVEKVGERADLKRDIDALVKADEKMRADEARNHGPGSFYRLRHAWAEGQSVSHSAMLPDKVPLLLRLGETELAVRVWRAWTVGMRENTNDDSRHLNDPFLMLATDWVWAQFDRAVTAHMRGEDGLALTSAAACQSAAAQVEKTAAERGFPRTSGEQAMGAYLPFTEPLAALRADTERRLASPRGDIESALAAAEAVKEPPARARALLALLDEVAARQDGQPGGVNLGADHIVQGLIAIGEPAVEPLLACL